MANAVYPLGLEALLSAAVNYPTDTIKVRLLTSAYTYSGTHQFLSDLPGGVGTDQALGSKTVVGGDAKAANSTWTAVAGGSTVVAYVAYQDTGVAGTSRLLAFVDHDGTATAISIATDGTDITVAYTAGKVFGI